MVKQELLLNLLARRAQVVIHHHPHLLDFDEKDPQTGEKLDMLRQVQIACNTLVHLMSTGG